MFSSPAGSGEFIRAVRFFLLFALTSAFGIPLSMAQPQAAESSVPSIPIIVADFELFSVFPPATSPAAPAATRPTTPVATPSATPIATASTMPIATPPAPPITAASPTPIATASTLPTDTPPASPAVASAREKLPLPLVNGDTDLPSVQARRLTDFFSETLLQILQQSGYNAAHASGQNPSNGVIIRGVFAETDAKNRIRRSLWRGASSNTRFFLYVGIFNLARADQPLYQPASEQPANNQYGPIITLNTYIPLAKYELDKHPTEEDVRKICAQIATSLTALLASNPDAFSQ